jgi:hypothetical protein
MGMTQTKNGDLVWLGQQAPPGSAGGDFKPEPTDNRNDGFIESLASGGVLISEVKD